MMIGTELGRFLPWEGLAKVPTEPITSAKEAMKLAGLDWLVDGRPLYDEDGNLVKDFVMNTRMSDKAPLYVVTKTYNRIQNFECYDFIEDLMQQKLAYVTGLELQGGRRIVFIVRSVEPKKVAGEAVTLYAALTNAHTGLNSLQMMITPVREASQTPLNIKLKKARRSVYLRHTRNVRDRMEDVQRVLGTADKYLEELDNEGTRLAMHSIDWAQFKNALFPEKERTHQRTEQMRELLEVARHQPDLADYEGSAWQAVNAVADVVSHMEPARKGQRGLERRLESFIDGYELLNKAYNIVA